MSKEWFQSCLNNKNLVEKLRKINLIISDIDGCLTDGKVYYSADDEIQKNFSIQDGYLMAKCNKQDMPHLAFVTGRSDKAAEKRAAILGIPKELYFHGKCSAKSESVVAIQEKLNQKKESTLFFGDDLLDLDIREEVGIFASPINGLFYIKDNADIVVPKEGGNGAFRLLLDLVLYVQKKHIAQPVLEKSLQHRVGVPYDKDR